MTHWFGACLVTSKFCVWIQCHQVLTRHNDSLVWCLPCDQQVLCMNPMPPGPYPAQWLIGLVLASWPAGSVYESNATRSLPGTMTHWFGACLVTSRFCVWISGHQILTRHNDSLVWCLSRDQQVLCMNPRPPSHFTTTRCNLAICWAPWGQMCNLLWTHRVMVFSLM